MAMRLKPWQLITITCELCDSTATWEACLSEPMIDYGVPTTTMYLGSGEHTHQRYCCPQHYDTIMDQLCNEHGMAMAVPLRDTWSYWLTTQVPGLRWIDRLLVCYHNWKFDRNCIDMTNELLNQQRS